MIDLSLNAQLADDYNPVHTHGGSFSGVLILQVPSQIKSNHFDGQICFHGPEEWHIQIFRTGMAHFILLVPADLYLFPAWQMHSVSPFLGKGERWSIAFNVLAVPSNQPRVSVQPAMSHGLVKQSINISLFSSRPRPRGDPLE